MNFAHLHLLLNHFPILGTMIAFGLFLLSFTKKNSDLRRASLIIFAAMAVLAIPTFLTGYGAQLMIRHASGVSPDLIDRHLSSALLSIWFMLFTGALALIGLWQSRRIGRVARWNVFAILLFSLLTVGLMARTGNTGGDIRHPEITAGGPPPTPEGTLGAIVHVFEPNPQKFAAAMIGNKWWWAFMMDLHFIGLALIVGTAGILDLRIMGFLKQLPIAPLHKFIPWAMVGLAINVATGILAFIGQAEMYVFTSTFWWKILALMLLGVNVAAFYLMDVSDIVDTVEAGESTSITAKVVAATSLVLVFAVIAFGRYIQVFTDSIPRIPFK